jgi:hypothetical protein
MLTEPKRLPDPPPYAVQPGKRYVLPCPVLGLGGLYEYVLVDAAAARRWLLAGPCVSYLTHPLLKAEFDRVMGFFTPWPRRGALPRLDYHDDALLFQVEGYELLHLQTRGDSRRLRELVEQGAYTLGFLRHLA